MEGEGPERIELQGLREAVILASGILGPRVIAVRSVRLSDTAALIALLEKEVRRQEWVIERHNRLTRLARLDHDLTIVLQGIVPILVDDPFYPVAGRELLRYGWSLQHMARSIFGPDHPLYDAAGLVGRFLRRHARHQHKGTRGAAWLAGNIMEVRDRVSALKTFDVQFPKVKGDAGGAAGDDDDGAEFPEEDNGADGSEDEEDQERSRGFQESTVPYGITHYTIF
ncbi:hypothetical protein E2562_029216 [Oryza meyeriana var. granulata]|uniref:Uncharacterized protein n=1 Tax=Oryza meyeriana var. granulata TaxID=110450 RepID=A0A6G1EQU6_9ORYZ|nr:hypothetical protein E2562_029216 [Oryza meyeriana var. granulata]